MAINPFAPDAGDIEDMGYVAQAALANRLIANRGLRLSVDITKIRTTLRLTEKDAGIDAFTDVNGIDDSLLSTGTTVWQFKASWDGPAGLKKELRKPGVNAAFAEGAGYTLVVGKSMAVGGHHGQMSRQKLLEGLAREEGCSGRVRLVTPDLLAAWIAEDPAALFEVMPQVHGFMSVGRVLQADSRHAITFESDDQRSEIIESISTWLHGPNPQRVSHRIQGAAGVGKTRLALEAVQSAGLEDAVLYSPEVPSSLYLFDWVANNERAQAMVIIDECEEPVALEKLEARARMCGGRLRLLTVGPGVERRDVFALGVLDDEAMTKVVNDAAAGLPDEIVRWIVQKTEGFVKLAYVVAQAISRRGIRNLSDLPRDSEVSGFVQKMLIEAPEGRDALQGIALLSRVGFKDGVEAEGQAIAKFIGIDWNNMQRLLKPAIDLGIVSTRGRYWYVSPELLGLWLAADFWRSQSHRISELVEGLPFSESVSAFYSRFSGLGEIPEAKEVLEQALGPQGPFQTIESLNDSRISNFFSALARTVPLGAADTAFRLTTGATRDELLEFGKGRREFVWALESLLTRRDTFLPAVRTIGLLAEAENESINNSATGVWADVFLVMLAETEVPFEERLGILEGAIRSSNPITRRLGVVGLSKALEGYEVKVLQGSNSGIPRGSWRPKSVEEFRDLKRGPLGLLALVVADPDEVVRKDALAVLIKSLRYLVELRLTSEWVDVANKAILVSDAERRNLWGEIQLALEYEKDHLNESDRSRLEELASTYFGTHFSDRLRRYLGKGMAANILLSEDEWRGELEGLAREAVSSQAELIDELSWLTSGEAEQIWPFAVEIGKLDVTQELLPMLLQAVEGSEDSRLLSGYLEGQIEVGGDEALEWREALLDDLSKDEQTAPLAWDATTRGRASDNGLLRLLHISDHGWVDPTWLALLRYGAWPLVLSDNSLSLLLDRLHGAGTPEAMTAALDILDRRISVSGGTSDLPTDLAALSWRLLENPAGWSHEPMLSWGWKRLGKSMMEVDALRVAAIVVQLATQGRLSLHDEKLEILERSAADEPEATWNLLGEALLESAAPYRFTWELQAAGLLTKFPAVVIETWLRENGCGAARVVAQAIPMDQDPIPDITKILLRECAAESGPELARNFLSGTWIGNSEPFWQKKLDLARRLSADSVPQVAEWAVGLLAPLQDQVNLARRDDAERGVV